MRVARGSAVGNHGDRLAGGVGRVELDLDVEHGGQPAKALRTDAQRVDFVKQLQAHFLDLVKRLAGCAFGLQLVHVDVVHQAFFGQENGFFCGAANANAQHAGRAPAGAHGRYGFEHPVHDGVARVEHGQFAFIFGAAAFGGHRHLHGLAGHQLGKDHSRCVVLRVGALEVRIGDNAGTQGVVRVFVAAAHAFVDGVFKAAGKTRQANIHAELDEDVDDAGVLADRPVAGGAHLGVGEDLRNGVFGCRALLALIGACQVCNEIGRVVVADELQSCSHRFDQVFLLDVRGHGCGRWFVVQCSALPSRTISLSV